MDSLGKALALKDLPQVHTLLADLTSEMAGTVRLLLPRTPLLQFLQDLEGLADRSAEPRQKRALQNLGRVAIARHEHARRLFALLESALGYLAAEDATDSLSDLSAQDARLSLQMLHFAGWLVNDAGLPEKAELSYRIALSIADRFGLTHNRAVVLHEMALFEEARGHLAAADRMLEEASALFAETDPAFAKIADRGRVRIYLRRLRLETNPPQPDVFDKLVDSYPEIGRIALPVLARMALDRDDFSEAERILVRLNEALEPGAQPQAAHLLVEAKLARRRERLDAAELLLDQAATAADASGHREEILWERFYLARDLGRADAARAALTALRGDQPSVQVLYQEALVRWNSGETDEAKRLFRQCLAGGDETVRANCLGMLALCADSAAEGMRSIYAAIGLYFRLDRKLDHALSLSHLAVLELAHADDRKAAGVPVPAISEYSRADRLFQAAQNIGEALDAAPFVVQRVGNRAVLEWHRGRRTVALRHFDAAARQLEQTYLSVSDRGRAEAFFNQHLTLFGRAIDCAAQAGRPRDVLRFFERGKGRRLLRDVAEMNVTGENVPDIYRSYFAILPPGATDADTLPESEKLLVTVIQPLRTRLMQGRPISLSERKALHDAQLRIQALGGLSVDAGPLGWEDLRARIFGEAAPPRLPDSDEEVQELPGGGVMICPRCLVYNRIASTFCSACEAIQPKTATINLDVFLGGGTEEELKSALADHLYDKAVHLLHEGKPAAAEELLVKAMRLATHPDYHFFHAVCRLADADVPSALADFHAIRTLQFAEKYPSWPLPVTPGEIERAVAALESDPARTEEVLGDLMASYALLSARRAEALA